MADGDDVAGLIGGLFLVMAVVTLVIMAVMALMSIGAVFGSGTALRNYALAFNGNVRPERVTP